MPQSESKAIALSVKADQLGGGKKGWFATDVLLGSDYTFLGTTH